MLSDEQCRAFRPLGQRLLVQRYPLQEQSRGGVMVLGRDFPTMGRIHRLGHTVSKEFSVYDEIQWTIKPDFDQRCVIGPDWLCLEDDDINVRFDDWGIARAVGNRVLLSPLSSDKLLTRISPIIHNDFVLTKWALGNAQSVGAKAKTSIDLHTDIIYNPSFRSELKLNNYQYFVVRDEDCIATVED